MAIDSNIAEHNNDTLAEYVSNLYIGEREIRIEISKNLLK